MGTQQVHAGHAQPQRLRRPPDGYGWFTLNGAFLLASLSTGLVLEVVDN